MARKKKSTLVRVGDHLVAPELVAGFKQAKKGLYILMLKNVEEMQYPLWVSKEEMDAALRYFDVQGDK